MKHIFENLNNNLKDDEKHFKEFIFNNIVIKELAENTFDDVTSEKILITENSTLKYIHSNAFTATNSWVKEFTSYGIELDSNLTDHNLFSALILMNNLTDITIYNSKIKEIPSDAFRPLNGPHKHLVRIAVQVI